MAALQPKRRQHPSSCRGVKDGAGAMMTTTRRLLVPLLAVLMISVAGCSSGSGEHDYPPGDYRGPITEHVSLKQVDIEMDVPTGKPAVSWEQAYQNCQTGDGICDSSHPPVITLASVTAKNAGQMGEGDTIIPVMDKTLAYVVTQTGLKCLPVGPARPSGAVPSAPVAESCTLVNFIDAKTGTVLYSASWSDQ